MTQLITVLVSRMISTAEILLVHVPVEDRVS